MGKRDKNSLYNEFLILLAILFAGYIGLVTILTFITRFQFFIHIAAQRFSSFFS